MPAGPPIAPRRPPALRRGQPEPPPPVAAVRRALRSFSARGLLLYLLPLPLAAAVPISLLRGDYGRLGGEVAALALLYGGAALARRGLRGAVYPRRGRGRSWPLRTLAAVLVAAGAAVAAASAIGHPAPVAAGFGLAAFAGCALAYGLDRRPRPRRAAPADEDAARVLRRAEEAIARIEAAGARLRDGELGARLARIAALAREVVALAAEDATALRRARRFLSVHLDGAGQVCESYTRTARRRAPAAIEEHFRGVLVAIEEALEAQRRQLLADDLLDLDVRMEVLEARLRREGVS